MPILAASRYFVDKGRVGIGSPLKAVNNWARRMREKMHVFPLRAGKFPCQQTTNRDDPSEGTARRCCGFQRSV